MATHVSPGRAELMMMILTGDGFYLNAESLLSISILQFVLFMHLFHLLYFVSNDNNKDVQSINHLLCEKYGESSRVLWEPSILWQLFCPQFLMARGPTNGSRNLYSTRICINIESLTETLLVVRLEFKQEIRHYHNCWVPCVAGSPVTIILTVG